MFRLYAHKGLDTIVPKGAKVVLTYLWGWTKDDGPGKAFDLKHIPQEDESVLSVLTTLHKLYIDTCALQGTEPRDTYGFEGMTSNGAKTDFTIYLGT